MGITSGRVPKLSAQFGEFGCTLKTRRIFRCTIVGCERCMFYAVECVTSVQGHSGSLISASFQSAYAVSC